MIIQFSVDTKPFPQARPRVVRGHAFDIKRVAEYKKLIAVTGRAAMRGRPPISTLVAVDVTVRRNIKVDSRNYGDLDNHIKAVLDALNGVIYTDDRLVVSLSARKEKNVRQGVDISVETLPVK